jgi:integrase
VRRAQPSRTLWPWAPVVASLELPGRLARLDRWRTSVRCRAAAVERTPFKIGSEAAIALEREIPRNRRLPDADAEQRLLDAANPHLRGVITAMLDTACRPGEILSLQWRDVSFERRELTIRAERKRRDASASFRFQSD